MYSTTIAAISLACACGGVVAGMLLRYIIPGHHLDDDSKEGIKLGTGIIATMAALVLGLLVSGATTSFNAQSAGLQQLAGNLLLLDRTLAHYGPETREARARLHDLASAMADRIWPSDRNSVMGEDLAKQGRALFDAIRRLQPSDEVQRDARDHALEMNSEVARARWLLTHRDYDTLPTPFLVVLCFWFFVLFVCLGAFWTRNATVVCMLFLCAVSIASAMFLIVDLDRPFEGLIQVSRGTFDDLLSQLGQ
jgi:hypothetical protein